MKNQKTLMTKLRECFRRAEALPEGSPEQEAVLEEATELLSECVTENRAEAAEWATGGF